MGAERAAPPALPAALPGHRGAVARRLSLPGSPERGSPGQLYGKSLPRGGWWPCEAVTVPGVTPRGSARPGVLWVQCSRPARQGHPGAPPYLGTAAATRGHLLGLRVAGTAGASSSVPSACPSRPSSHRQSGPAHREHALPAPQAAEGTHGGRARPGRPAPPARLQGGLAAGPAQGRDADGRQRVPPPPRQGCLRCGGTRRGGSGCGGTGWFCAGGASGGCRARSGRWQLKGHHPLSSGLLYYAGHGYENFGNSFMVPIDAPSSYTSAHCLCVQRVLQSMQQRRTGLNIFLLDMCRKR